MRLTIVANVEEAICDISSKNLFSFDMFIDRLLCLKVDILTVKAFMQAILLTLPDRVAFSLWDIAIYWYSFAYIFGIGLGYLLLSKYNTISGTFSNKSLDDVVFFITIGIVIGGRLGYCLIYDIQNTVSNPLSVLMIRDGGMSFHGGMIGAIIFTFFVSQKHRLKFLACMDLIAVVSPIGLFLGRLANLINAESCGLITDVSWAILNCDGLPRHPTQIYEATLEGPILFFILRNTFLKSLTSGRTSYMFLILYGFFRFAVEFFKEPEGFILGMRTGQILCICMIGCGVAFLYTQARGTPTRTSKS